MSIIKELKFLFLFLVLAMVANIVVDPAGLFFNANKVENCLADNLVQGNHQMINTNFDERILLHKLVQKMSTTPASIMLGSSRSMMFSDKHVQQKPFYNMSLSSASLEDILAIIQILSEHQKLPTKKMIIEVDSWFFNKNNGLVKYESIFENYVQFKKSINEDNDKLVDWYKSFSLKLKRFQEAISPTYTQATFKEITRVLRQRSFFPFRCEISNATRDKDLIYISPDLHRTFADRINERTIENVNSIVLTTFPVDKKLSYLSQFTEIDPSKKNLFEKMILLLQNKGIEVSLVFPPYHPLMYSHIVSNPLTQMSLEVETYLKDFSVKNNIKIVGTLNPASLNLVNANFYDEIHLNENGVDVFVKTQPDFFN